MIRQRVIDDRGERDASYIRRVIKVQRGLEVGGRGLLFVGFLPPAWLAGMAALSLSKILDNMEIGHNVMHGQFDWMNDPKLSSKSSSGIRLARATSGVTPTTTCITPTPTRRQGPDIGYGVLRMSEDQKWRPYYLGNPLYAALLATFFQYGVALHDVELERIAGKATLNEKRDILSWIWGKVRRQTLKDYGAVVGDSELLPTLVGHELRPPRRGRR